MGITALWCASWLSPQTKLYCQPWILKRGERGLGAGQKHIHDINKNKSFIPKGHNSSEQLWNRTENAILTSLGLHRVNKLTLFHYVKVVERPGYEQLLVCLKWNVQTSSSLVFAARTRQEIGTHCRYFNWPWREKKKTLSKEDKSLGGDNCHSMIHTQVSNFHFSYNCFWISLSTEAGNRRRKFKVKQNKSSCRCHFYLCLSQLLESALSQYLHCNVAPHFHILVQIGLQEEFLHGKG